MALLTSLKVSQSTGEDKLIEQVGSLSYKGGKGFRLGVVDLGIHLRCPSGDIKPSRLVVAVGLNRNIKPWE